MATPLERRFLSRRGCVPEDSGEDAIHCIWELIDCSQEGDLAHDLHNLWGGSEDVSNPVVECGYQDCQNATVDQA